MRSGHVLRASLVVAVSALLAPWAGYLLGEAQTVPSWIPADEQTRIVQSLRTALPQVWTVTVGALGRVPDEWRSIDLRTFEVDGRSGDHVFHVWFLPADWIGIRQPDPARSRMVYWEGVLGNSRYKSITIADQVPVYEAVQHAMGMNTPSLVNSGWTSGMALFGDRLADVDRQVQTLIGRFCRSRACIDEAAYSLIVLGVPSRTPTLDCAEHAVGEAQAMCASALGHWKSPESLDVLNRVVANPSTSSRVRRYAAFALQTLADRSSGPALGRALRMTAATDRDGARAIADAIARIRYRPAASDILARLMIETDHMAQTHYVQALAAMRYEPAVPTIEKLCATTNVSAEWIGEVPNAYVSDLPEVALLRLTAPWGSPVDGIRVRLLGPQDPIARGHAPFAALVENVSDEDLEIQMLPGAWVVDGKEYRDPTVMMDGNPTLYVNSVTLRTADLSESLSTPGTHAVHYRLLGARSNELSQVSPASQ